MKVILKKTLFRPIKLYLAILAGIFFVVIHLYLAGKSLLVPGSLEREREMVQRLYAEGRTCCWGPSHIAGEYVKGDDVLKNIDIASLTALISFLLLWGALAIKKTAQTKRRAG